MEDVSNRIQQTGEKHPYNEVMRISISMDCTKVLACCSETAERISHQKRISSALRSVKALAAKFLRLGIEVQNKNKCSARTK